MKTVDTDAERLSRTFAALADPTRRTILERLRRGDATLGELAAPIAMSLQGVSRHVQVLEQAGLVRRTRLAQQRPARLVAAPLTDAAAWLAAQAPAAQIPTQALDAQPRKAAPPAPVGAEAPGRKRKRKKG